MKRPTTRVREHFRPGSASNASSQHLLVHALLHLALPVEPALLAQLLRLARRALDHLASIAVEPGLHTRYACRSVYQQTTDERHATCDAQQPDPILSDLIRSYPILSDPILSDLIRSDLIRSDPIRSDPIRSDLIRSDPILSDPIRSDPIRSYPIRSDLIRSDPILSDLIRSNPARHSTAGQALASK
jgi:hypothetical protein